MGFSSPVDSRLVRRMAARPISVDKGVVQELVDTIVRKLLDPNHVDTFGIRGSRLLDVQGKPHEFTVAVRPEVVQSWSFVPGGYAELDRYRITVAINQAKLDRLRASTGAEREKDTGRLRDELRSVLLHEVTHLADLIVGGEPSYQTSDVGSAKYYNAPDEVRAYLQQIVDEVERRFDEAASGGPEGMAWWYETEGLRTTNDLMDYLLRYNQEWARVLHFLTPENRKLVLRAVYRTVDDRVREFAARYPENPWNDKDDEGPGPSLNESEDTVSKTAGWLVVATLDGEDMLRFRNGKDLYPFCTDCQNLAMTPISGVLGCRAGDDPLVLEYSQKYEAGEVDGDVEKCPGFSGKQAGSEVAPREASRRDASMIKEVPLEAVPLEAVPGVEAGDGRESGREDVPEAEVRALEVFGHGCGWVKSRGLTRAPGRSVVQAHNVAPVSNAPELDELFRYLDVAGVQHVRDEADQREALTQALLQWNGGLLSTRLTSERISDILEAYRASHVESLR